MSDKKDKEKLIKDLEDLQLRVKEANEYKKEKLFFQHMFRVYLNSNISIIVSFLINLTYFFLTYNILLKEKELPTVIIFIIITSICTNISIALFRCGINKEILAKIRKISKVLAIQLVLLVIVLMISFIVF